jgi:SAM-dependent methyltransferase
MQREKLERQSLYARYHNQYPFIAPIDSYQKTEIKLILEEVPEYCLNIIDFCCGTGRIATILMSEKRKIIALDQSQVSLSKINIPDISPACCIAQAAPIKGDWADCVLFIQAFQYIPIEDHNIVLKELNRLLKKDGRLIISTFCYDSLFLRASHIFFKGRWKREGEEHGLNGFKLPYHRFTKSELVIKLHDAGFEITSMRLFRNYPFNLLSSNIDYLIAKSGLKLLGSHIIVCAKKISD